MTSVRVFVYGTMTEGMVHFSRIQQFVEKSVTSRIKAEAYRLKVGFPALIKDGNSWVEGQLVDLKGSEVLLAFLDEFFGFNPMMPEKSLYHREQVDVFIGEGIAATQAWAYFLNPKKLPATASVIPDGDWKRSLDADPAFTETLTDRQKLYIRKLGAATGREIVPINDLSLYRELMNLELIVDKGRRLALSHFGKEVYRYLG